MYEIYKNYMHIIQFHHIHKALVFFGSSDPHFLEEETESEKLVKDPL